MMPGVFAGGAMGSGGGGGADPYWANVVSLLHFDGANGSTAYPDSKGLHTWTRSSPAAISTAQSKFGGASGFFTVSTASRITSPSSSDWNFGTGNFTIESQMYFTGTSRCYMFDIGGNVAAMIITPSSGLVEVYGPGSWVINAGATPFSTGQWYAVALVRNGNVWTVYRNGIAYVSNASDSRAWGSSSQQISVGAWLSGSSITLPGYMDELRITKGIARYTGAYTPQAAAFPNS
jgi:hypothetical protein